MTLEEEIELLKNEIAERDEWLRAAAEHATALEDALRPLAELDDGLVAEPHPCLQYCLRVGGPCDVDNGVCVECGLRSLDASTQHRTAEDGITYGDVRRAKSLLAGEPENI